DQELTKHPNMMVDLAARIPELWRHDPQTVHDFFVKYQDRIIFATDFQSLARRVRLSPLPMIVLRDDENCVTGL
ncbi:MAG: hypothetical protein ACREUK_00820, partial [Burkholderiales bacterium]